MKERLGTIVRMVYFISLILITLLLDYFYNNLILDLFFIGTSLFFPISLYVDRIENKRIRKLILPIAGQSVYLYFFLLYALPIAYAINYIYPINVNYIWIFYILIIARSYYNHKKYKIKKYIISSKKIKDKLKIIFFSDLHLNEFTKVKEIEELVKQINLFDVDIIINGGDLLDSYVSLVNPEIKEKMKLLKSKYGVYGVLGNHEFHGEIDENRIFLTELGINLLEDQSYENEEIYLIGKDSLKKDKITLDSFNINKEKFVINVDHIPARFRESVENNIDLHLSGHTHAGQFFPINILYRLLYPMIYGHKKRKETNFIVSSGFGVSFIPYRNFNSSEITYIEIINDK